MRIGGKWVIQSVDDMRTGDGSFFAISIVRAWMTNKQNKQTVLFVYNKVVYFV